MQNYPQDKGDKILILTLTGDVHVPFVTRHLSSKVVVVDPTRILEKYELSFLHDGQDTVPIYGGNPIKGIKSVWYRKPYIPEREDLNVPVTHKDYAYTAVRKHIVDLYGMFQDAFWLSDYFVMLKAEIKPRQLELAARLGFNVPKTLSTSSSTAATAFLKEVGDAVTKSMATTLPIVNNKVQYFYTTKIAAGDSVDLSGLHVGPAIFQKTIDVEKGLRITIVDNKVFAAAVRDKNHKDHPAIIDWRRAYVGGELRFEAFDLPKSLQRQCLALTKALNLRFGAIDLLLDKNGTYWFLEINPNGQWAFIEEDTGHPIGKAVADLLEARGNNSAR